MNHEPFTVPDMIMVLTVPDMIMVLTVPDMIMATEIIIILKEQPLNE